MFLGLFIFGNDGTREGVVRNMILGLFNMVLGAVLLYYAFGSFYFVGAFIKIFSIFVLTMGFVMVMNSFFGLRRVRHAAVGTDSQTTHQ